MPAYNVHEPEGEGQYSLSSAFYGVDHGSVLSVVYFASSKAKQFLMYLMTS